MNEKLVVHLDHIIAREDVFYTHPKTANFIQRSSPKDDVIKFYDIEDGRGLFAKLRKPDFQRQTNAWTPDKCVDFLDSVLRGWLIPHIILWRKPGSDIRYILDGAHRVSVVKAWMENDWGDSPRARKYYARQDRQRIEEAAEATRELVARTIGDFKEFRNQFDELKTLSELEVMALPDKRKLLLEFLNSIEDTGLGIHWAENNSYEEVAQSFVRINRGGQPLDEFEVYLIEHRKSSFVRSIMAIAGSGAGTYWPPIDKNNRTINELAQTLPKLAENIHRRLFEPAHEIPPTDVHQPFMPTPPYFRKHLYLRELLPILVDNKIISGKNGFVQLVSRDEYTHSPEIVIRSSSHILNQVENKLKHLTALANTEPLSLDIVPLFYWYNRRGQLVRTLCYGYMYWMLGGTEEQIRDRKLVFSGNRDRFEEIIHTLKAMIAGIHFSGGAALRSTERAASFFEDLLLLLHHNHDKSAEDLIEQVKSILGEIVPVGEEEVMSTVSTRRSGRNTSIDTHGKINRLFKSNHKCHICGGHIDWKRSHQLDHVTPYREEKKTTPDGLEETHQFCNNNREIIQRYKQGLIALHLPRRKARIGGVEQGKFAFEDSWNDDMEFPLLEEDTEEIEEEVNDEV